MCAIQSRIDVSIFSKITECKTSKEAWVILDSEYKGSAKVQVAKLQLLRKEFKSLHMREEENIIIFFSNIQDLVNFIHSYGDEMGDTKIMKKVVWSLPRRFDPITIAIEEAKDLSQLTLVKLQDSLTTYEYKISDRVESLNQAFQG